MLTKELLSTKMNGMQMGMLESPWMKNVLYIPKGTSWAEEMLNSKKI